MLLLMCEHKSNTESTWTKVGSAPSFYDSSQGSYLNIPQIISGRRKEDANTHYFSLLEKYAKKFK